MATEVQETKKVELKEVSKETSRTGGRTTTFDRNKSRNNQRNNNKNQRRQNTDDIEKRIVSIRRVDVYKRQMQTLRAKIDYAFVDAQVPNAGKHGIKVWVYTGEKLDLDDTDF